MADIVRGKMIIFSALSRRHVAALESWGLHWARLPRPEGAVKIHLKIWGNNGS